MRTLAAKAMRPLMAWMVRKMPACDQASRLSSEGLDRDLYAGEKLSLKLHSMMCRLCRRYDQQIRFLHDALQSHGDDLSDEDVSGDVRLSDEARERIAQMMSAGPPAQSD